MEFQPTLQTTIFLSVFVGIYLIVLLRNTIKNAIDFYDLLLLSSVAIIPLIYILAPKFTVFLAQLIGVGFSFLILFGLLFVLAFIYLYRLNIKLNEHQKTIILLTQEIGLLRQLMSAQKPKNQNQPSEKID